MTLSLDHQQRLNLIALLGAQKASVDEMRSYWKLQDQMALSEEEKREIDYRIEVMNGNEAVIWDRNKKLPPKAVDVSEVEATRIWNAIKGWPAFMTSADRVWLESLITQLPAASENGQPKT